MTRAATSGVEATQLFVYYRVTDAKAACRAVAQAQAALRHNIPQLLTACYVRHDERGPTLMESYTTANGVDAATQTVIAAAMQAAVTPWLQGVRHEERFQRFA